VLNLFTRYKLIIITAVLLLLITGCNNSSTPSTANNSSTAPYLTMTDDTGRSIVLSHKPERIVVLSPSFLELLYSLDGHAVGRPNSKLGTIPLAEQEAAEVGFVYNINLEKVVALQPDLVIGLEGMHDKFVPILESNHIPVMILKYKTYDDVFDKIALFGTIAGSEQQAHVLAQDLKTKLTAISNKLPAKKVKVAILHATAKSVTLELDTSIAGSTAKLLQLENVAADSTPLAVSPELAPYSLEKLVEKNPDILLVVTMGNSTDIEKNMNETVKNNPAWLSLQAVKNNKVVYLPSDLFLLNPGLRMPEAVGYMANIVYPEIYANAK